MNPEDSRDPVKQRIPKILRSGKYLDGHYCPIVNRSYIRGRHGEALVVWHFGLDFDTPPPLTLRMDFVRASIWQAEAILAEWILDKLLEAGYDPARSCTPSDPTAVTRRDLFPTYHVTGGHGERDSQVAADGRDQGGSAPEEGTEGTAHPHLSSVLPRRGSVLRERRDRPRREVPDRQPRLRRPGPVPLPKLREGAVPKALPRPAEAAPVPDRRDESPEDRIS